MKSLILGVALLSIPALTEAGTIWHWSGPVTGYTDPRGGASLSDIIPMGSRIDVIVSLEPDAPAMNPSICLQGTASATLQVMGRSFTNGGFVWEDAMGFGPGLCAPLNNVEIVVPAWGSGGPAMPDGWIPFGVDFTYLPGLWWSGNLADGQPQFISGQFPLFYLPGMSWPQRFTASLEAVVPDVQPSPVPEPATMTMVGVGLALAARQRLRRQRNA